MRKSIFAFAVVAVLLSVSAGLRVHSASVALTGVVGSENETRMEGVLVGAKKVGSTIRVIVVSDEQGRYAFPSDRLQPGKYQMSIRAAGYDLENPGIIEVSASKTKETNLKLRATSDLAKQLTTGEWLMSVPGTNEQKKTATCMTGCHSIAVPLTSKYDSAALTDIIHRMHTYAAASFYEPGEVRKPMVNAFPPEERPEQDKKMASYLSSINLSSSTDGKWKYELKTFPRPKGTGTRVIMTEYDVPRREFEPHDVQMDPDGMIWSADFAGSYLDRLNPVTGEVKEWKLPLLKPGSPAYGLDVQIDKDGNPWMSMMDQGGIAKFDKKTEKFTTWMVPPDQVNPYNHVSMVAFSPDNKVWFKDKTAVGDSRIYRLDPKTNHVDMYNVDGQGDYYGMRADSLGNLFLAGITKSTIARIDVETGKVTVLPLPTPDSGPQRAHMDSQDRFWFGESRAAKIGMFDTRTQKFSEWDLPRVMPEGLPLPNPYGIASVKAGDVWTAGTLVDYLFRLNPKTGQITTYLLPTVEANIRRISGDNSNPNAVWLGENHHAKIVKVEPLE